MFLSRIIFRVLRIIQIQGIDFTYQGKFQYLFYIVAGLSHRLLWLCPIAVPDYEMLHQQKNILVEVYLFLTNF